MTVLPQSALRRALSPLAAAAITALCVPASSHAQSVTFNLLSADGSYALNGGAAMPLNQSIVGGTGSVDVLSFPNAGVTNAGLHSYGSSGGNFGSRSSGTGLYDVTGAFTIKLKLTNNQATAQQANFAFYITPGYLNVTPLPFTGSQFVEAGVSFNISTSNGKSFSSTAMLRDNSAGISFASTGANLYGGSGASRSVIGGNHDLDLGVLNAGQSVDLSYTLSSYAKGNALVGTTTTVPGYQQVITHVFVQGDPYLDGDAVFAVKDSLVAKYKKVNDAAEAKKLGMPNPFTRLEWDFHLSPVGKAKVNSRKAIAPSDALA